MPCLRGELPVYLRLRPSWDRTVFTNEDEAQKALEAHNAILHQRILRSQSNNLCAGCSKYDFEFDYIGQLENEEKRWENFDVIDGDLSKFAGSQIGPNLIKPGVFTTCHFCNMLIKIFQEYFPANLELLEDINVTVDLDWAPIYREWWDVYNEGRGFTTLEIASQIHNLRLYVLPLLPTASKIAAVPIALGSDVPSNLGKPIQYHRALPNTSKHTLESEPSSATPPRHAYRRPINENIDYGQLARWIRNCDQCHVHPVHTRRVEPLKYFRLIDVNECCIVDADPNLRYAALSYTWAPGQYLLTRQNYQALKHSQSLCQSGVKLRPVITDAMIVCRRLGIQFLWCDALCIMQDDSGEMLIQIKNMDYIYSSAYITIIDVGTVATNEGLSRVTQPNLRTNRYLNIGGKTHVLVEEVGLSLDRAKWNTRGWTFQENILSRRRLFFADSDVVFHCEEDVVPDSLCFSDESELLLRRLLGHSKTIRLISSDQIPPFDPDHHPARTYDKILSMLTHYVTRDLTHEIDYLNAFQGIWESAQPSLGMSQLGLPINVLARALLWCVHMSHSTFDSETFEVRRRPMFPSWSWSGWSFKGSLFFSTTLNHVSTNYLKQHPILRYLLFSPLIRIHGFRTDNELVPLPGEAEIQGSTEGYDENVATEFSKFLEDNGVKDGSLKGHLVPEPPNTIKSLFVSTYNGIAVPYLTSPLKHKVEMTNVSNEYESENCMAAPLEQSTPSPIINPLQLLVFWASIIRVRIAEKPMTREEFNALEQGREWPSYQAGFKFNKVDFDPYVASDSNGKFLFSIVLNTTWRSKQHETLELILVGQSFCNEGDDRETRLHVMAIERVGHVCYRVAILHPIKREVWIRGRPRTETIVLG